MSRQEKIALAFRTALATFCGTCCLLAIASALVTIEPVWREEQAFRQMLASHGLAGQGHCWLCGMSHAFRALWRGRFEEAASDNPNSWPLFGCMLLGCLGGAIIVKKAMSSTHGYERSIA